MNIWKSCKEDATTPVLREEDMLFEYTQAQYEAIGDIYISAIQNTALREAFEDIFDISEGIIFEAKGANREITRQLSEAKALYKKYVKEAKRYISDKNYDAAYDSIEKARNEIADIEDQVSKLDMNAFNMIKGWILSSIVESVEYLVPNLIFKFTGQDDDKYLRLNKDDELEFGPPSKDPFKRAHKQFKTAGLLGKFGHGLNCTIKIVNTLTDIYGFYKTIADKGNAAQALNGYRSKILAMFKSLDVCLVAAQKDILRMKKKNNK